LDIARTPLVKIVSDREEAIGKNFEEILAQVRAAPAVARAQAACEAADHEVERLQTAHRVIIGRAGELLEQLRAAEGALRRALIDGARAGQVGDIGEVAQRRGIAKISYTALNDALTEIVEHMMPAARIQHDRAEVDRLIAEADELDRLAGERTEQTLALLREAVEFEGQIETNFVSSLSGALVDRSGVLRDQAARAKEYVQELERAYHARSKEKR
jgi:hypothetical protein